MLRIEIGGDEFYDEETETFSVVGGVTLELEHSLVSLSKWESKYKRPFLSGGAKSEEETLDYIRMMVVEGDVSNEQLRNMSQDQADAISEYINSPESATTFGMMPEVNKGRGETITAELIYYWLVAYTIPFEVETWHLNRLLALVRICNIKNSKPTKMSRRAMAERNRQLNEQRRAQLGTTG